MDGTTGTVIHLLIETAPAFELAYYLLFCEHSYGFWSQAFFVCMTLLWFYFGILVLYSVGLARFIFQMEFLVGAERALSLSPRGQL